MSYKRFFNRQSVESEMPTWINFKSVNSRMLGRLHDMTISFTYFVWSSQQQNIKQQQKLTCGLIYSYLCMSHIFICTILTNSPFHKPENYFLLLEILQYINHMSNIKILFMYEETHKQINIYILNLQNLVCINNINKLHCWQL